MKKLKWMALCAALMATPMAHAVAQPEDEIVVYGKIVDDWWRSYGSNPLAQGMPGRYSQHGPDRSDGGHLDADREPGGCRILKWTIVTGPVPAGIKGWLKFIKRNAPKLLVRLSGLGAAVAAASGVTYAAFCTD